MSGGGVLLGFNLLLSVSVLRVSTDENCGFGGVIGKCINGRRCPSPDYASGRFPPGGSLCIGKGKKCCFPADQADCMNMGGTCIPGACDGIYKPLPLAPPGICRAPGHNCCVKKDEDRCIEAKGTCHDAKECPKKFEAVTFPFTDMCPGTQICCVNKKVEPCFSKICYGGRCRCDDCKSGETTGKFPKGGDICAGKDCRCCIEEAKASCMNMGGRCFDAPCEVAIRPGVFKPLVGSSASDCPVGFFCCVRKDVEDCNDIEGACVLNIPGPTGPCPEDFYDTGVPCGPGGYSCCLHNGIEPCTRTPLCPGKCRTDNKCKSVETAGTFPKGGDICGGKDCKCCVLKDKAGCINNGGECFTSKCNAVAPAGNYQNLAGSCPAGQYCCELKADVKCRKVDGKCSTAPCPANFVAIGPAGFYCRPGYRCCVHEDRADCAINVEGRCFKGDDCPAPYISARGKGRCRGRKMKCCMEP